MLRAWTLPLFLLGLTACGARAPAGPPPRLDVLQNVHLRGGPSPAAPRLALTFDGPTACTADLLARLRAPAADATPLVATFFFDEARLTDLAQRDPAGLRALLGRIAAEGHQVALGVGEVPPAWAASPAAFRRGLSATATAVEGLLRAHGLPLAEGLRLWRPAVGRVDWAALGQAAAADRPLLLWSQHADGAAPGTWPSTLLPRLGDGDVVALPGGDPRCAVVEAVPALAAGLAASGLQAVTVDALMGPALRRHHPVRTVRYLGPGLDAACAERLALPVSAAPEQLQPRWGLVTAARPEELVVVPLPGSGEAALTAQALPAAQQIWRAGQWQRLPGCQRRVPVERLLSPVVAGEAPPHWWVVTDAGIAARDQRAAGTPHEAVVLPTVPDLVRLEARQRLPWRVRGLVAGALDRLDLEVPLLLEGRASVAVLVGKALAAPAAGEPVDEAAVRAALAGYVQVVEFSLAEYVFLALRYPAALAALSRAALAVEGFVRAGPFVVSPSAAGGAPDPRRMGPNGRVALPGGDPVALVIQVLQAGHGLAPGDLVAAAAPPVVGPPALAPRAAGPSLRATLRRDLARAVTRGLSSADYLRPGSVLSVDGDHLGQLAVRVAVPAGVAAPTTDALPLLERRGPGR